MKTGLVIGLLCLSIGLTAWLIVGSHVSYAPAVTATRVQNIMIAREITFGLMAIMLQMKRMNVDATEVTKVNASITLSPMLGRVMSMGMDYSSAPSAA